VPFTEKTVTTAADQDKLRDTGSDQLPLLIIGRNRQTGFQAQAWDSALTLASYPESSMLPSNYQYPNPTALAPRPKAEPDAEAIRIAAAEAEAAARRKAAAQATPPGLQF
jgi:hypothetical protein